MNTIQRTLKHALFAFFILLIVNGCGFEEESYRQNVGNNNETSLSIDSSSAKAVLEKNLYYATEEDIEGYLTTISKNGHEETQQVMKEFFREYDVDHTLLAFEIVEEKQDEIVAKAKQKTVSNKLSVTDEESYKDHIAEVLHIFIKENDLWKINESSITDITFID